MTKVVKQNHMQSILFEINLQGELWILILSLIANQHQHSFKVQLGHSQDEPPFLHSLTKQLQSAHLILIFSYPTMSIISFWDHLCLLVSFITVRTKIPDPTAKNATS